MIPAGCEMTFSIAQSEWYLFGVICWLAVSQFLQRAWWSHLCLERSEQQLSDGSEHMLRWQEVHYIIPNIKMSRWRNTKRIEVQRSKDSKLNMELFKISLRLLYLIFWKKNNFWLDNRQSKEYIITDQTTEWYVCYIIHKMSN